VVDMVRRQETVEVGVHAFVDLRQPLANQRFVVVWRTGCAHAVTLAPAGRVIHPRNVGFPAIAPRAILRAA
jgi:hypothetical protein